MTCSKLVKNKNEGLTLIEIIIYVALLGSIAVVIANFLLSTVNAYQRARAEREVISNARLLLETVNKSVAQADKVYSPTSRFNQDTGQLSLVTQLTPPAGHTTAYEDFWVDNGRLWARKEGQGETPISAASVRVAKFSLEWIIQGLNQEAVKITLQIDSASRFPTSITLNSTTVLRGNY